MAGRKEGALDASWAGPAVAAEAKAAKKEKSGGEDEGQRQLGWLVGRGQGGGVAKRTKNSAHARRHTRHQAKRRGITAHLTNVAGATRRLIGELLRGW